jgi:hypothetical protein
MSLLVLAMGFTSSLPVAYVCYIVYHSLCEMMASFSNATMGLGYVDQADQPSSVDCMTNTNGLGAFAYVQDGKYSHCNYIRLYCRCIAGIPNDSAACSRHISTGTATSRAVPSLWLFVVDWRCGDVWRHSSNTRSMAMLPRRRGRRGRAKPEDAHHLMWVDNPSSIPTTTL